jgi:hypothetical protein
MFPETFVAVYRITWRRLTTDYRLFGGHAASLLTRAFKMEVLWPCQTLMLSNQSSTLECARGSVVGSCTILQAGRSRVRVPMRWIFFFNLPNPSSHTMALGSTQPLTEMSTRNLLGG